jgi:hypothetical protein
MTHAPLVESICLCCLSELERLEAPWLDLMSTGEPEMVATAMRMFHAHLAKTVRDVWVGVSFMA